MSYINETDFVIENKELVYPEIVTDGLQLYYDAKGKRDTDYHRDTMLDMSGNKNHGKLQNFAYEKHSGYKDGLVFDYIDDKLVRPALDLKPNDFTFMLNGNIISFSPDGTVKRVQDGEVIESKGLNIVRNGDFVDGINGWNNVSERYSVIGYKNGGITLRTDTASARLEYNVGANKTDIYYYSVEVESDGANVFLGSQAGVLASYNSQPNRQRLSYLGTISYLTLSLGASTVGTISTFYKPMAINLTETFGAGNEPTKEQMDEIINRFGFIPNAQDLIDRIEYKGNNLGDMENIIDGLYKTEVLSGEEIYTDEAEDNAGVHVDIDGKSYQYSEENLFTLDQWNSIPTSEKPRSTNVPYIELNLEPNSKYIASTNNIRSEAGHYPVFVFPTSQSASSSVNGVAVNEPREVVTGSNGILRVAIQYNEPSVVSGSYWIEVKKAPPAPDYPVEIHSLNDFDVVSSVGRENLLKDSQREWKTAREYVAPSYNLNEIFDKYPIGQTYTISFDAKSDDPSNNSSLQFYSNPGTTPVNKYVFQTRNFTGLTTEYQRFSHTVTPYLSADPSYPKSGMSFYGQYDTGNIPTIRNIKIELGTTATPYSPAPEDIVGSDNSPYIDKINLLLDEPLRSVGDVKDRLFRDSDGVWKIERNVGEYIINGTNAWTVGSPGGGWTTNGDTLPLYGALDYQRMGGAWSTNSITSRFPTHPSTSGIVQSNMESFSLGYATFGIIIRIKKSRLTQETSVGFVNWLKENPINVVYELKTSKVETLSQSLQDKLNNLRSFEESNYVYTVLPDENNNISNNLKPTLHAKFLYNNWYKEDRVINNLMIYNRALTNQEMLQNYKTIKRRWGM